MRAPLGVAEPTPKLQPDSCEVTTTSGPPVPGRITYAVIASSVRWVMGTYQASNVCAPGDPGRAGRNLIFGRAFLNPRLPERPV
jgi:hypothetical protein